MINNINTEVENLILNNIIFDLDALEICISNDITDDFIIKKNKIIYKTILDLYNSNDIINAITLSENLISNGNIDLIDGKETIQNIIDCFSDISDLETNIKILKSNKIKFDLYNMFKQENKKLELGNKPDLEFIINNINKLQEKEINQKRFNTIEEASIKFINNLDSKIKKIKNGENFNLSTGFYDLDNKLNGISQNELIVIGARPGMGKTSFMLNVAENIAKKNNVCSLFFSIEMSEEEIIGRLISTKSEIPYNKIKSGKLNQQEQEQVFISTIELEKKIIICDDSKLTLNKIKLISKEIQKNPEKYGELGIIIIDYMQIVNLTKYSDNRQQAISEISRGLKIITKELNVPIITAAQLSRSCEQRLDKRPLLSDLRESGAIEQDADVVMFLYRDEYYNLETEKKNIAELTISKNRNGETGTILLGFDGKKFRFRNLQFE